MQINLRCKSMQKRDLLFYVDRMPNHLLCFPFYPYIHLHKIFARLTLA